MNDQRKEGIFKIITSEKSAPKEVCWSGDMTLEGAIAKSRFLKRASIHEIRSTTNDLLSLNKPCR
jgi:hypothetical protein